MRIMNTILLTGTLLLAALGFNLALPGVYSLYDTHRLLAIAVLALVIATTRTHPRASYNPTFLLLALLAAVAATSIFNAQHSVDAIAGTLTQLALFFLVWRVASQTPNRRRDALIAWQWVAVAAALAYFVRFASAFAAALPSGTLLINAAFMGFVNIRHFAQLLPLLLPLILLAAIDTQRHRGLRLVALFAGLGWWLLIWLNGSSGAFYSVWIGFGVAAIVAGWRAYWRLLLLALTLCILAYAVIWCVDQWTPLLSTLRASITAESSGRWPIWQNALGLIQMHPWLGWGAGQYPHLSRDVGHPHNALLQLGLDHGLIAVALVATLVWRFCSPIRLSQRIRQQPGPEQTRTLALVAATFAGLAHSMVSGVTVMPIAQLTLAVTMGLLIAQTTDYQADLQISLTRRGRIACFAIGATLIAITIFAFTESCTFKHMNPGDCRAAPAYWNFYKL